MDGYNIFLIMLSVYIAGLVAIGWYFNNKQKSITDFWLAGRRIGPSALGFSAAASWLTAGGILAVIGYYMLQGMGSIWAFVAPNIISLLFLSVLVKKIKNLPAITQPELLEQRYGSIVRLPIALIITVVMILFSVSDITGLSLVLQTFYGLDPLYAAAIVAIAVSLYVTLGGLYAVIWTDTIQFSFLALFTIVMAFATVGTVANGGLNTSAISVSQLFGNVSGDWWNPFSIGLPMVLIFSFALIPGWITEQDPWQKVWAAKDEKSASAGMIIGALMITVIFAVCAVIAIALNDIYPEIAGMGYPAGMASAEPALLSFVSERFASAPVVVAFSAIGLAAASMSCTDTFSTSGASCISRDIYQRYIKPDATMKEMMLVNRASVLFIILAATVGSFIIPNILDAIQIATFIASSSYFFPLMGGLYWKRATKEGAFAGMVIGFIVQVALVALDLINTPPLATNYLESIHPILMGHGVIVGMSLSAIAFFGVSLITKPSSKVNLAPFFEEEAKELSRSETRKINEKDPEYSAFLKNLNEKVTGERAHLQLNLRTSENLSWQELTEKLKVVSPAWVTPTGLDSVYRLTHGDMLACVAVTRGTGERDIWLKAEPRLETLGTQKRELFTAYEELKNVFGQKNVKIDYI
ncbi:MULTISPECIES: sodium:solute symporter family protein [Methanosarcina]|uniref:Sodium-solute symporter, putative n=3 Tax=Methanosarcina barkeri TaxID=2208 RepID=A0A0E3QSD9_METBA|nr:MULTISPECIES: sodium:solute symporter family protein [Methanosarcina]AKB53360.1 sodium-solute symporter, putative [Methanosarcina barkeri MS]AKB58536.1 sodium-solute symporter, putative [Methanosarcina barkeri 227]AKJ39328.1 SSS family transporter [Methanosarcina barkeri CM1]OEC91405.1 sodium:proline symporter [Methanosarcina sp. A14]